MYKHGGDIYTYKNMLDFSANINPLGTPQSVINAACEGVRESSNYPDPQCRALVRAISAHEKIAETKIICGNGAADLIFSLCTALKPKKALLIAPSFYEYEQALRAVDCEIQYHDLTIENGFQLSEAYLNDLTDDVDIAFVCNPNNPTGILTKKPLLLAILEKCKEKGVFLVVDECFNDFLQDPAVHTLKAQIDDYNDFFILKAFTKIYAMAGLRLGYGLTANTTLLGQMKQCSQPWSVSIPAQKAGIAALKEDDYVKRTLAMIAAEKTYLIRELNQAGFTVYDSAANYLFFQGPPTLHQACLAQGVMIRDCSNYRGLNEGFYRIVVKQHDDNVALIKTMKKI